VEAPTTGRPWHVFLFLALILICPLTAVRSSAEECFLELLNPSYPADALRQRIMGSVVVEFTVGPDGKPTEIEAKGYPLLTAGTEAAMRSVRLAPACSGDRIILSLRHKIDDEIKPGTPVVANRLSATGYEVVAPGEVVEITISDPD
jgi:TonB family protein